MGSWNTEVPGSGVAAFSGFAPQCKLSLHRLTAPERPLFPTSLLVYTQEARRWVFDKLRCADNSARLTIFRSAGTYPITQPLRTDLSTPFDGPMRAHQRHLYSPFFIVWSQNVALRRRDRDPLSDPRHLGGYWFLHWQLPGENRARIYISVFATRSGHIFSLVPFETPLDLTRKEYCILRKNISRETTTVNMHVCFYHFFVPIIFWPMLNSHFSAHYRHQQSINSIANALIDFCVKHLGINDENTYMHAPFWRSTLHAVK